MFPTRITAKAYAVTKSVGVAMLAMLAATGLAYAAEPQPWQMDLQPAAGSIAEKSL